MKKEGYILYNRRIILLILIFLIGSVARGMANSPILTPEQMWEDLDYVSHLITRVHPEPFHSGTEDEFQRLLRELREMIEVPMERDQYFFIVNQLAAFVKDGHTRIFQTEERWYLPLGFKWVSDGIVITAVHPNQGLSLGDQVLEIGGRTPEDLLELLKPIIIAENPYALKTSSAQRLSSGSLLDYIGLVENNGVEMLIQNREGEESQVFVELKSGITVTDSVSGHWFGWNIHEKNSLGYFYLDRCKNTEEYRDALEEFFQGVKEKEIETIAMDVRKNRGGTSQVIEEFLAYLPHNRVRGFGMELRYSPQAQKQRGYTRSDGYRRLCPIIRFFGGYNLKIPPIQDRSLLFTGDVYILTSPLTFSSGNWFAVIIQDNELGVVLGEPTGNAPTSYGDVLQFTLPNSQFSMIVSHKSWIRPDKKRDPSDSLYPDIYVPTTIQDIRDGNDPQMEKLLEIIQ